MVQGGRWGFRTLVQWGKSEDFNQLSCKRYSTIQRISIYLQNLLGAVAPLLSNVDPSMELCHFQAFFPATRRNIIKIYKQKHSSFQLWKERLCKSYKLMLRDTELANLCIYKSIYKDINAIATYSKHKRNLILMLLYKHNRYGFKK